MAQPLLEDVTRRSQHLRAAYESREATVDFQRRGAAIAALHLNSVIAFVGPAIQGIDKVVRTTIHHPVRTLAYGALLALGTILLRWYLEDDTQDMVDPGTGQPVSRKQVYDRIPQWQRDLFWIVPVRRKDGTPFVWRIPKAHEWAFLFSTVVDRLVLDPIYQHTPDVAHALGESLGRVLGMNVVPDILLPALENFANWSFFRDRRLVSRGLEDLQPAAQYTGHTSEIAKRLGNLLNYPPIKIDHVLRFGHLANLGVMVADKVIQILGETPVSVPTRQWADNPILGAFIARYPTADLEPISQFYRLYERAHQAHRTIVHFYKRNDMAEAVKAYHRDPEAAFWAPFTEPLGKVFADIHRGQQAIRGNTSLSDDQKRDLLDKSVLTQTHIAEVFMRSYGAWRRAGASPVLPTIQQLDPTGTTP